MRLKAVLAVMLSVVLWPSPALANDAYLSTVGWMAKPFSVTLHGPLGPPFGICMLDTDSKIEFRWDGVLLGIFTGQLEQCEATIEARVPDYKGAKGKHTIVSTFRTLDGARHTVQKTVTLTETIGPRPKPTAKQSTKPAPKPALSSAAPTPLASPSPSVSPSPSEAAPSPSDSPSAVLSPVSKQDDGVSWLPLGVGAALVALGGGLGFWLVRRRRPEQGGVAE